LLPLLASQARHYFGLCAAIEKQFANLDLRLLNLRQRKPFSFVNNINESHRDADLTRTMADCPGIIRKLKRFPAIQ
jgi:hypothetical protein